MHLRYEAPDWVRAAYVVVLVAMLSVPLLAMPFAPRPEVSEKRTLAEPPQVIDEVGALNVNLLADAGGFFTDHFAFRPYLVDLNATIREKLFMVSATPNVVVGTDGWLYYSGRWNHLFI